MNMVKMTMNELSQELTAEELRELEAAEKKEPVFDDDSPMMMREQLMQFKRLTATPLGNENFHKGGFYDYPDQTI